MKIINLEAQIVKEKEEEVIVWTDKETGKEIFCSTKRDKHGSDSNRIILYKENSPFLPQWLYLSRVEAYTVTAVDNVIGAAIIKDKLIVQLQSGEEIFMLSKPYKQTVSDEDFTRIQNQFNLQ